MQGLNFTCQGYSHKAVNKVCQDYSYFSVDHDMTVAIVCDGHGGERYFRSDVGAKMACEVTANCVRQFVNDYAPSLLLGQPFTQKSAQTTEAANIQSLTKTTAIDRAFRQLFSAIIFHWRSRILTHAHEHALSDFERTHVPQKHLDAFLSGKEIEKTYGCTLMCFVHTSSLWFAFHIGDGKCIAFDANGKWLEPIPWDEQCFLNKTTSLCDSDALNEFRYAYAADGSCPIAWCLGSDGVDDSFGTDENLVNFYIQLLKQIVQQPKDQVQSQIESTLPQLSKIGSQDDMSLVCVYDFEALCAARNHLINWQRDFVDQQIHTTQDRIQAMQTIISQFPSPSSQKEIIDVQYAQKQLAQALSEKEKLIAKWNKFSLELDPSSPLRYGESSSAIAIQSTAPIKDTSSVSTTLTQDECKS